MAITAMKTTYVHARECVLFLKAQVFSFCGRRREVIALTQTKDHLLEWPMLPQACTTEDLMEYIEAVKECVFQ